MSKYIEQEAVMRTARDGYHSDFGRSMADLTSLSEVLEDTPTADVVESKRGEWIKLPSNGIGNTAECSVCHDSVYGYESCDFCPNCGADMRGDE